MNFVGHFPGKGGSVEETINSHHTANLCYLFKKCLSQFLSNWELAEPVFSTEELSCLPYKKPQKKPDSQFFGENIQI